MFPDFQQFKRWARRYRRIPVWIELPDFPRGVFDGAWALQRSRRDFAFLDSPAKAGRYAYLTLSEPRRRIHTWPELVRAMGEPLGPAVAALPPFWGGAVGFLSYECARYFEPKLAGLLQPHPRFPEVTFGLFDEILAVDQYQRKSWVIWSLDGAQVSRAPSKAYREAKKRAERFLLPREKEGLSPFSCPSFSRLFQARRVRSERSLSAFEAMVRAAKAAIARGDIYQANLSRSFSFSWSGTPWTLYQRLRRINPSPYACLIRFGEAWIVSSSPELLLRLQGRSLETRPIAGTRPRGDSPVQDQRLARSLLLDPKERAEHIMLVDLERNDLGRVCRAPSVRVSEKMVLERYSHVIHIVSHVRGVLEEGPRWPQAIAAAFPGGTITGCPKIRCMEIIRSLESAPRGPYCGSAGWIGYNGDMALNILIRSFFLTGKTGWFSAGAGIVADSHPLREYRETRHKAEALLEALGSNSKRKVVVP